MKRWRREPDERGLARVMQRPRGLELRESGKVIATVVPSATSRGNWFWHGFGQNTCYNPVATKEEAKAQVMTYIKEHKI